MFHHQAGHHFAQCWTMLEAVPGASSEQPDSFMSGVAIDDEIIVGRIFILANPGLEQRSILQSREPEGDVFADNLETLRADCSFP